MITKNSLNDKGERHGYWEVFWDNNNINLKHKGNYINGKRIGYWETYFHNGLISSKGNFINGKEIGCWEWFHFVNHNLARKIYFIL